MPENETNIEQQQIQEPTENLIKAYNDLKANSVPIEKYNEAMDMNRKLVESWTAPAPAGDDVPVDLKKNWEDRRKALEDVMSKDDATNLEYWSAVLPYREATIALTGKDPFVGENARVVVTDDDRKAADKVAKGMQHCVDVAQGDPAIFNNEVMRITNDTSVLIQGLRKKTR